MHRILKETHKKSNIDLMKARDFYFEQARVLNNRYRAFCIKLPIIISVIGTLTLVFLHLSRFGASSGAVADFLEQYLEIIVGVIAIFTFIAECFISHKVGNLREKSNRFRERYDCRVLGLDSNDYFYCSEESQNLLEEAEKVAGKVKDKPKYEVWYRETFCDDDFCNAVCMMMDNIIYTYNVYDAYGKRVLIKLICCAAVFLAYTAVFLCHPEPLMRQLIHPVILFTAVFDYVKELVSNYLDSIELAKSNKTLKDSILAENSPLMSLAEDPNKKVERRLTLRSLQDVIIRNRDEGLFIPRDIRNRFLENKENNEYYVQLDKAKQKFWAKHDVIKPQSDADYEISSLENEETTVTLETVHKVLLSMLEAVSECLKNNGIPFMLDGGTLLGAIRNNGFLPWDDDIDISMKESDFSRAVKALMETGYDIQLCYPLKDVSPDVSPYVEDYYSPRLARFRIRQPVSRSIVSEKDSALYEKYKARGLFLDVYTYHEILLCRPVDSIYRMLVFHPLYRRLRAVESSWKPLAEAGNGERALERFKRLKARFGRRLDFYLKHAKCTAYYTYVPGYIEGVVPEKPSKKRGAKTDGEENTTTAFQRKRDSFIKSLLLPGPYLKKANLYGPEKNPKKATLYGPKKNPIVFCGSKYEVPADAEYVLEKFYGSNWKETPYKYAEVVKANAEYSSDTFDSSCYKHLKNVSLKATR